jgi:TM2 domain-containing membrane protein YozV
MKRKSVAALLAIFLGGLGIHKFYLNKPVQGILYLIFCWTWIPMIIGFFEGLHYATSSDERFERDYPQK